FEVLYLEEQHRQKADDLYSVILNGIRAGQLTRSQLDALQARANVEVDPFVPRTRLLTTNADVDKINYQHLAKLEGEEYEFEMTSTGAKTYVEQLKKSCLASQTLRLKRGAVVMCIRNAQDRKYHNGSLGVVEAFEPSTDYPIVKLNNGKEITIKPDTWELVDGDKKRATLTQFPLRLAWAITVHKSQGMTLDSAQIDLSNAFVEGMGYVALSRVRGLKDLVLDGMNGMALRTSPLARSIDIELRQKSVDTLRRHHKVIEKWKSQEASKKSQPKPAKSSGGQKPSWADRLAKMRQEYPNAYKPWSGKEDEKLVKLFGAENTIKQLSNLLGRHPGSIRSRLRKLFGDDIIV
ncbi:AAA family ATPase, partial [Candidatus Saccharibacteria bacterium]|nr:AAA family ATPase [Candidatus Saccharibacteria bacterium]